MTIAVEVAEQMVEEWQPTLLQTDDELLYVTETPTGLTFSETTPEHVWGQLTQRLIRQSKRIHWAIADAINFGGKRYSETYAQWIDETGLAEQTLTNIAWVGRQIEISRRRENVGFTLQAEVASLRPSDQDRVLNEAVEHGWHRSEIREKVKEVKKEQKRAERALLPTPTITDPDVRILVGDARSLNVEPETADLVVTSPPYALAKSYTGGDVATDDWLDFMLEWLTEAYRVSKVGGRLAVNIPLDTSPEYGSRPTYGHTLAAAERAGWVYRSTIVWHDDQLGKSTARGSLDSASSPYIYFPGEMILLMQKGPEWGRPDPDNRGGIDHQRWLDWTNGYWFIGGESNAWEDHPAPYPVEVPRRLIELLSFFGDLVLDPFLGSGTTAVAAVETGRRFYGVDASESYVRSALRRVAR